MKTKNCNILNMYYDRKLYDRQRFELINSIILKKGKWPETDENLLKLTDKRWGAYVIPCRLIFC